MPNLVSDAIFIGYHGPLPASKRIAIQLMRCSRDVHVILPRAALAIPEFVGLDVAMMTTDSYLWYGGVKFNLGCGKEIVLALPWMDGCWLERWPAVYYRGTVGEIEIKTVLTAFVEAFETWIVV